MRVEAFVVLFSLLLAGCSSPSADEDPTGAVTDDETQSEQDPVVNHGGPSAGQDNDPDPAGPTNPPTGNHAPVANLTAAATNGTAPFIAVRHLNGTDADGDALTWTVDFGDGSSPANGTELPTDITHEFTLGSFNVTLTVSDGTLASTTALVMVAGAGQEPLLLTGTVDVPDPQATFTQTCSLTLLNTFGAPPGVFGTIHPVLPQVHGWAYSFDQAEARAMFWAGSDPRGFGSGGLVPEGTTDIWVCAVPPAAAMDYALTLSPA